MSEDVFLTAEWRNLVFANYTVEPDILQPYVPLKTELDFFNEQCYVSLVGFMFNHVRVRGLKIPLHTDFPEVNLRFYVRYKESNEWKRGVVFIKEIVPKRMISLVANTFFGERYVTMPVTHNRIINDGKLQVAYAWKSDQWNQLLTVADPKAIALMPGSQEEFITQHFWGYTSLSKGRTGEYHVQHPEWEMHPVLSYEVNCDFGKLYGNSFRFLNQQAPASVFLAGGSPVEVYGKRMIR
jgi:uncharacterized protein YqjF (DUF2071 family)